jgi:hypothetical protein
MNYWGRRLLLLPLTLIAIAVVNFAIINLAPGEPTTTTDVTEQGEATRRAQGAAGLADPYFQFREEFGLNLPILLNTWPWTSQQWLEHHLEQLVADPAGTAARSGRSGALHDEAPSGYRQERAAGATDAGRSGAPPGARGASGW